MCTTLCMREQFIFKYELRRPHAYQEAQQQKILQLESAVTGKTQELELSVKKMFTRTATTCTHAVYFAYRVARNQRL